MRWGGMEEWWKLRQKGKKNEWRLNASGTDGMSGWRQGEENEEAKEDGRI